MQAGGGVPLVMGIINVTPDSFSDGGVHFDPETAVASAVQMAADGAAIIDIGGESTRPGAQPVSVDVECRRVMPVIERIRAASDVPISIDTRNAVTARAAFEAGADIINDVSALQHDVQLAAFAAGVNAPVILMHMRGTPATMQSMAQYEDVVREVRAELQERVRNARLAGVTQILVDPGIGFAKVLQHNVELLARCGELASIAPLVVGASRKKFVGLLTGRAGRDRAAGSLAAVAAAARGGAAIVRVHDVRETLDFLRVWRAIDAATPTVSEATA